MEPSPPSSSSGIARVMKVILSPIEMLLPLLVERFMERVSLPS